MKENTFSFLESIYLSLCQLKDYAIMQSHLCGHLGLRKINKFSQICRIL